MKRKHLAAFLVLLAVGCSQTPAPDAGSSGDTLELQVTIPTDGGQTADAAAVTELTSVTLNVPMT